MTNSRDNPDDEEWLELEAADLEMGNNSSQDLKNNDHEENPVGDVSDPTRECPRLGEEVQNRLVKNDSTESDQNCRYDKLNEVLSEVERGQGSGGAAALGLGLRTKT